MSDVKTDPTTGSMSSPRLAQFQEEVGKLKVTGGGANPERLASMWGIGLTIAGFVIAIISWFSAQDSSSTLVNLRSIIFALIGIGISIVGMIIWLRNSITRYLRYWIIRLVYEQREQTEQLIEALRNK
jgi:drug/metabolite transporter (DMT)-like permease